MPTTNYNTYKEYDLEPQINVYETLMRYKRNWPWFVLSLTFALAACYIYLLYQPTIYKVQASLLIKDQQKGITEQGIMKELNVFTTSKVVENEVEILKSYNLMDKVVRNLGLDVRYYYPTSTLNKEIYSESPIKLLIEKPTSNIYSEELRFNFIDNSTVELNGQRYPTNQSIKTPYGQLRVFTRKPINNTLKPIIATVSAHVSITEGYLTSLLVEPTAKQSSVLSISLEETVSDKGEAILNQLIYEYNKESIVDKSKEANKALNFIEERLVLISGELSTVEREAELYKSAQGITNLSDQAQTFLTSAKENDTQLNEINIRLGALADIEQYLYKKSDEKGIAPSIMGFGDPILIGLLNKLSEIELKREVESRTTSSENPLIQSLNSQLKAIRASINENILTIRQQLVTNRNQLLAKNQRIEGMIRSVPSKERSLLNITRQQAIKNSLYTYLLQKREETAISAASTVTDSRTIDTARTNNTPVKPQKIKLLGFFVLAGFLFPIGFILIKDVLNNRIVRRSEIEAGTQAPILVEVVKGGQVKDNGLIIKSSMQPVISEQLRMLRTKLLSMRDNPQESQVVLFTSCVSGEGKSFVSLNLGTYLAIAGYKTVILEMDLRNPKIHKSLHIENRIGISDYIIGEVSIEEILNPIKDNEDYYLITAGTLLSSPAELLSSYRLSQLFLELKNRFDFILVDSSPIGLVTDSEIIAPFVNITALLMRYDYTPKSCIKMVDDIYKNQQFKKMFIVLNSAKINNIYYKYVN